MVKAAIFDLDGVLIDSEPVWEAVRRAYVEERDGRWLPDTQRRLLGMSTAEWSRYLKDDLGVPGPPDAIAADVIARMAQRYESTLPLLPGAAAAVRRLGDRWPLGLASSSPPTLIERVLAAAGLASAFSVVMSTEHVGRGKPAPDIYLAVAARLGVPPSECVAIEDSSNGLRAASAADMVVVAVPHHRYPPDPDALALADLIVGSLDELTVAMIVSRRRDQDVRGDARTRRN